MTKTITLPASATTGALAQAIALRRSVREFQRTPVPNDVLAALLWAAQGVAAPPGLRTAPSAGALYPLELYVANEHGVFHYQSAEHQLQQTLTHDVRGSLGAAAFGQTCVAYAPAVIVFGAAIERTVRRYGERGRMYVHMEVGHAAQNLMLSAVELGYGTVAVGAFDAAAVATALRLPEHITALYLVPVGRPNAGGK
jgi:SagB-type dehydrogenase family enzyme